jgi:hypothetical protein
MPDTDDRYVEGSFPLRLKRPDPRPVKGASRLKTAETRRDTKRDLDKNKAESKVRDQRRCRLPHCPWCKEIKGMVNQSAHVIQAAGMGGDSTLIRSQVNQLLTMCPPSHAAQERGEIDVVPLTDQGTNEACAFYLVRDVYDKDTGRYSSERSLWDSEVARGVPAHAKPLVAFDLTRRTKVQD